MDIFKLYRHLWDYSFKNPELLKPNDIAIYSFAVEHCNRLGWKEKFGFPTTMVMEAVGIKSYSVYKKHFDNLVENGFFKVIQYSKNQYSANIIALKENTKATDKALDKALIKHTTKQSESTQQSNCSIDKQYNKEQINQLTKNHIKVKEFLKTLSGSKRFIPPTTDQVKEYCLDRKNNIEPQRFIDHYTSNGWMVGKNKMKDWKASVRTWEKNNKTLFNGQHQENTQQPKLSKTQDAAIGLAKRVAERHYRETGERIPYEHFINGGC